MSDFDDNDDDVFAAKASPSASETPFTFDNTAPPSLSNNDVSSSGMGGPGNGLPRYLQEALAKFARTVGGNMLNQGPTNLLTVVECFHEYVSTCNVHQKEPELPSLLRATFDVLDEMTEGRVSLRTEVYMTETKLGYMMSTFNQCNDLMARLINIDCDQTERSTRMIAHLKTYLEILEFNIKGMRGMYLQACEEAGYSPSQSLLDTGVLEFAGLAHTILLGHLPHTDNIRYGNTSMQTNQEVILREVLFSMLYQHLYASDEALKNASIEQVALPL